MKVLLASIISVMAFGASASFEKNVIELKKCMNYNIEMSSITVVRDSTNELIASLCKKELITAVNSGQLSTSEAANLFQEIRDIAIEKNIENARKSEQERVLYSDILKALDNK